MDNQIEIIIKDETGRIDKALNDRLADYVFYCVVIMVGLPLTKGKKGKLRKRL